MNKARIRGCVLVIVGILLVCCALGVHISQKQQDAIAGQNAAVLLKQLELNRIPIKEDVQAPVPEAESVPVPTKMPEKTYLGYAMIGSLRIPSVQIQLPVMSSWDQTLLNLAPCRYQGSIPDGNMIIMGHNYKSHFTPLHNITLGAEVEFENVEGVIYRYRVAQIVTLHRSEGEKLPSGYPLTLFTCTPGGLNRLVVRCEQIEG